MTRTGLQTINHVDKQNYSLKSEGEDRKDVV
jgi:hypothetical protein